MTTQEVKRKLAAILSADVKGYSRLMGEDEKGTVRTLNAYKEVMTGLIQNHHGRVVDAPGDNVLADFASVVDAVECAVEIQKELKTRNIELPENLRMEFRIGVNLGDVIEEGDKILGDGVNIAARLESLSEAGGICISGTAYDQVENKLSLGYEFLGEQAVKNIAKPIRVYRVLMEPEVAGKVIGEKKAKPRKWPRAAFVVVAILVVVAASIAIWKFYIRPSAPLEVASKEKMAFPLPNVPSIAVLPFVNMSGDPKQEFLCDGMTEEIITALSKVGQFFVIARQSTFAYKDKPVKVKQVSEELGVRYVLEGSLQRSGDRVRINAQLIDALTGNHLWAERYDRDLKDLFAVQDEITMKILIATQVKLTGGEAHSTTARYFRGKKGLDCYLKISEGFKTHYGMNNESITAAGRIAEEAIAMCPEVPIAYLLMAHVYFCGYVFGIGKSPEESLEKGIQMAQKALAMDDSIANAHGVLSMSYNCKGEHDKAIAEGERAVALEPGGAFALETYAWSLTYACRLEEAIPICQEAIRLNPSGMGTTQLYVVFGLALRLAGRYEEAVSAFKKALQRSPDNILAHNYLAACYINMGREKEARAEAEEILKINPKFSVDHFAKVLNFKDQSQRDNLINALRKAGLK
jgi:adenylate cyclase